MNSNDESNDSGSNDAPFDPSFSFENKAEDGDGDEGLDDASYIARMVFHQMAIEVEEDAAEDGGEEEKENPVCRAGDLASVKELWESQSTEGALQLPADLLLDAACMRFLVEHVQGAPQTERPSELVIASQIDGEATEDFAEFVLSCQSSLQSVTVQGRKRDFLRSEQVCNRLFSEMRQLEKLTTVALERIFVSPVAIRGLAQTFSSPDCRVRSLSFSESLIYSPEGLADLVGTYSKLEMLSVNGCELGDENLALVARAIAQSGSALTHLNLSSNVLTKTSLTVVARIITGLENLSVLNLSRNLLFLGHNGEAVDQLQSAMAGHRSLQVLRLNCCGLNTWTVQPLMAALKGNSSLLFVQFACTLGDMEAEQSWAESLTRMKKMRSKLITTYWTRVDEHTPTTDTTTHLREPHNNLLHDTELSTNLNFDTLRVLSHNRLLHQISIYMEPPSSPRRKWIKRVW